MREELEELRRLELEGGRRIGMTKVARRRRRRKIDVAGERNSVESCWE